MATITQVVGTRTGLTISGFNGLASGSYATSNAYDCTATDPLDVILEVNVLPGTTSGNLQVLIFAIASLDGTNYQTGINSNNEQVMNFVGAVPVFSNATAQMKTFSIAAAFGGVLPAYFKIVCKNDSGATLDASGNTLFTATVVGNVV